MPAPTSGDTVASGRARAASRRPSRSRRRRARARRPGRPRRAPRGLTSSATPAKPTAIPSVARQVEPRAEEEPVEDDHPERDRGDHERGDPGRHRLLRPRDAAVADREQERPGQQRPAPLAQVGPRRRAVEPPRDRVEQRAGEHEPGPGHEQGRQRLDRERDAEVGRPPDEVDRRQRGHDAERPPADGRRGHDRR